MNKCSSTNAVPESPFNPLTNDEFSKSCLTSRKYNLILIVLVALTLISVLVKK